MTGKKKNKSPDEGRPKVKIDWAVVDKLLSLQCTRDEIAAFLKISSETLKTHCKETHQKLWEEYAAEGRKAGLVVLRKNQFKQSENNPALAIFLGKNYLDQVDRQETKHGGDMVIKVEYQDDDNAQSR